ncbi:hypothetical protein PhaeoP72_04095 (plasmid) [Phaeobacter inhibens]|uniref:hypothetical protein n=1 Tax=Phaeobacter inhibens TaxID=221822 RepID=UPI00076BB46F|nr:hypothetical protein [Phaeobacter inhibens]AUR06012.1 hypothetical protein PhaeoP72_04095 [Phaeobacter inhibens]KXF92420.1 hypothetical protein AT574_02145 [Phaeobacter inhibens]MDO6758019.1 hypothetical protein [Phaeobacter inhibens]UWR47046.1 hypothetical protein K4F86_18650 [Phaeobacter inhibens]UWR54889.1 hypothetical protein K4F84_18095 [Phaeobacter inhibens]
MTLLKRLAATLLLLVALPALAHAACTATNNTEYSAAIAHGHAYTKHSAEFVHGKVIDGLAFPDPTIANADEFATFLLGIMNAPTESKPLANNRYAYWHTPTGTVIITNDNANDCGTAFRPLTGKTYYDNLS